MIRCLKIRIHTDGKRIWLPSIPLVLANLILPIALKIAKKHSDNEHITQVNYTDIKLLIRELKRHGPFTLVDVDSSDGTKVSIKIT